MSSESGRKRRRTEDQTAPKKTRWDQETSDDSSSNLVVEQVQNENRDVLRPTWSKEWSNVVKFSKIGPQEAREIWSEDIIEIKSDVKKTLVAAEDFARRLKEISHDWMQVVAYVEDDQLRCEAAADLVYANDLKTKAESILAVVTEATKIVEVTGLKTQAGNDVKPPAEHKGEEKAPKLVLRDEGEYALKVVAKRGDGPDPVKTVYRAISKVPVNVQRVWPKPYGALFLMKNRKHLCDTKKILGEYEESSIGKFIDHFDLEEKITAKHAIKTAAFGTRVLNGLKFIVDGRVDQDKAIDALVMRNSPIFKGKADLIAVEMFKTASKEQDLYVIKIHVSGPAHSRMLKEAKKGTTFDLEAAQLQMFDGTEPTTCFKCHAVGHKIADCMEEERRCKYCGERHAGLCKIRFKKKLWRCYKCRDFNLNKPCDAQMRNETHAAGDKKCMSLKQEAAELAAQRKKRSR